MTLESKGPIVPPPALPGPAQVCSDAIQAWPGIRSATHWDLYQRTRPDGADFYVGEQELGHIHLNGEVHLATDALLHDALLERGLAQRFPYGQDWLLYRIRTQADADHALWLFQLNYRRLRGASASELRKAVEEGVPAQVG